MTADERRRATDILDAQEGSGPVAILDAQGALELLASAHRIAVIGASPDPLRASNDVMRYLLDQGYDCVPVNPNASEVLGRRAFGTLEEAASAQAGAFDIVVAFRRAEHTPAVAEAAAAVGARALWLQLGIVSWEAAGIASESGLLVVMDRCTAIDHRRLRVERRSG